MHTEALDRAVDWPAPAAGAGLPGQYQLQLDSHNTNASKPHVGGLKGRGDSPWNMTLKERPTSRTLYLHQLLNRRVFEVKGFGDGLIGHTTANDIGTSFDLLVFNHGSHPTLVGNFHGIR